MGGIFHGVSGGLALAGVLASGAICAGLIVALRPLLVRYALARPNARSSHREPTPQGGGIAVLAAVLVVAPALAAATNGSTAAAGLFPVLGAAVILAILGACDDIRTVGVLPRLFVQAIVVATLVLTLSGAPLFPALPRPVEAILVVIAGVWFVNLVNFMDGLDLMTVAETVPIAAAIVALAALGVGSPAEAILALALAGAMLGFAWFNRPVARIFLGDVGSLPIGLMLGFLLLQLAGRGHVVAALLLPLYYLADATITLARRLARGEQITQAHRSHFYQRATDNKFTVPQVVGRVFAANLVLAALAIASVAATAPLVDLAALAAGALVVAGLLWSFVRSAN